MASIKWIGVIKATCKDGGEFAILGSGFTGASQVYFVDAASKKIPASQFTVVSDETIECSCPPFSKVGPARGYVVVGNQEATPVKNSPQAQSRAIPQQQLIGEAGCVNVGLQTEYGNEFNVSDGY
ncbi:hypothetical protein PAQ31011_03046 [Pandoraea aquatica]|uniref:IPT/TIG domain-containing protein n=1 Tax=Pandoraea aquatica TaxID=2508290 RepID=A0A5E4W4Z4_9BURK|nr:IPT/TIG domain-containing protein [Pandoraea aquatica]VVE18939.1 hypothetical protein PAQ31011_03046 [Pandoraea aquatica]